MHLALVSCLTHCAAAGLTAQRRSLEGVINMAALWKDTRNKQLTFGGSHPSRLVVGASASRNSAPRHIVGPSCHNLPLAVNSQLEAWGAALSLRDSSVRQQWEWGFWRDVNAWYTQTKRESTNCFGLKSWREDEVIRSGAVSNFWSSVLLFL